MCVTKERRIIEEKARQQEEKKLFRRYNEIHRTLTRLLKKLSYLENSTHSLENTTITCKNDDLYCNMMFLSAKLKEYQETEKRLESDLTDMEVEEIYEKSVIEKYKLYLELLGNLANIKQFLDPYRDLPPNLAGAKLMLENKRKEFEQLERQIFGRMND
ncbi:hypothetical protein EAI_09002 [Harpegnathos saltator]|uniref:Uncharacterized protein n=1 Tax=Harpegnathos saltator TaxID=610380 RepID=E2BCW8_HARSA|nr:hypothetical protein EAI_09002 [Harpegnathos saltator]